ncbi:MAG: 4'-phosphopantetheinyl transferase superfamily protein [Bacteroidia bacterium]
MAKLNLTEFAEYYNLTDKRSIEKQAAAHVVKFVLKDNDLEILYKESGKPYLLSEVSISISHSYDWLVILFSSKGNHIGIDIEKVRDKILNIKEKFLSKEELTHLQDAPPEKYTIYWSAKEAIYKALDLEGLNFSEQIFIEDFSYAQAGDKLNVQVSNANSKKNHILQYLILKNYVLVYTEAICE